VTCAEDWRDEQRHMARLWEGLASEYCLEKRLVTREGHETWAQAATTVIRDAAGQPQYAVQVLEDITARKEAERVRAAYQTQLRALTLRTTINEERERRRIAQNLHDQIGQSLAIARMQLGKLGGQLPDDDRRRQEIEEIRTLLSDALDYSRTVTCELSPPILHELGLVPALRWLARHFGERYHLPTELEVSEPFPRLSTQLRVVLYHVIRELLVNIVKHADATHAIIHLMRHDGAAIISVEDDGRGVHSSGRQDEPSGGYGLFSVRERVEQLGGAFVMESSRQRGTRCVLRVPLAGTSGEEEEGWA
jgi:signal transduction histidine kinase